MSLERFVLEVRVSGTFVTGIGRVILKRYFYANVLYKATVCKVKKSAFYSCNVVQI